MDISNQVKDFDKQLLDIENETNDLISQGYSYFASLKELMASLEFFNEYNSTIKTKSKKLYSFFDFVFEISKKVFMEKYKDIQYEYINEKELCEKTLTFVEKNDKLRFTMKQKINELTTLHKKLSKKERKHLFSINQSYEEITIYAKYIDDIKPLVIKK